MVELFSQDEINKVIEDIKPYWRDYPCDDAISRQGLLDTIDRFCDLGKRQLKEIVLDLPPVTPKQRTGHWIECEDEVKCFCSECKEISDYPTKFCPNCGAKMEEMKE